MFFFIFSVFYIFQLSAQPIYKNHNASTEERVADLLSRMTLQEKIGQLSCLLGWEMYEKVDNQTVRPSQKFLSQMDEMPIGAFWATLRADPWTRKTLETGLNPRRSRRRYRDSRTRCGRPRPRCAPRAFPHAASPYDSRSRRAPRTSDSTRGHRSR